MDIDVLLKLLDSVFLCRFWIPLFLLSFAQEFCIAMVEDKKSLLGGLSLFLKRKKIL